MITFKDIGKCGRLGNQLFQIAILKTIALKKGYHILLPFEALERCYDGQKSLLPNFVFKTIKFGEPNFIHTYNEKADWFYDENIFNIQDNTNFAGYFQNPKYFIPFREQLIEEFQLAEEIEFKIQTFLKRFNNNTVSLHIRRGDYSDGSIPSNSWWSNDLQQNSILNSYYSKAFQQIPSDSTIFLFTGGSKNNDNTQDLQWCKNYFKDERIIFVDFLSDIESFALMKSCDYNITSFVSSFTWWSAFLNKNNNVVAPLNYHPTSNLHISDLCPLNWKFV